MNQLELTVAVAASFTPDLVKPAIEHWLGELGVAHLVTIAPYNQLFQELLDQELREQIAVETAPLRNLILAHAYSRTGLPSDDHE